MTETKDLVHLIADEAVAFSAPVIGAALNPWQRARLLRSLGWDLTALSGFDAQQFDDWLDSVRISAEGVSKLVDAGIPTSFKGIEEVSKAGASAAKALTGLPPTLKGNLPAGLKPEVMAVDLVTFLTVNRVYRLSPVTYRVLVLAGLISPAADNPTSEPVPADSALPPVRLARRRDELRPQQIVDLLTKPGEALGGLYAPNGVKTAADADRAASLLFPRVAVLLREIGIPARYGVDQGVGPELGAAGAALSGHMLSIEGTLAKGMVRVPLGVTIGIGAPDRGGLGIVLVPHAALSIATVAKRWSFKLDLDGDVPLAVAIQKDGVQFGGAAAALRIRGEVTRLPDATGHILLLGPADGTHLAIGQVTLSAFGSLGTGRDDFGAAIKATGSEVLIKAGDGDNFLKKVLPAEGLKTAFDLGVAWSRRGGLVFEGGAALATTFPLHIALGPLHLEKLYLALQAQTQTKSVSAIAGIDVRVEIGPVKGVVERIGIRGDLTFPGEGGNLGAAHLVPRFKAPDGIGATINAKVVTGGGYLNIDEQKGQYAGALALGFESQQFNFKIAAIGVLNTKLPTGQPIVDASGAQLWSLIVVAAAQWSPKHIAYGVHISGAGLVVGIHRTIDTEAMRAGIRDKSLDAVLFPPDPVGNAPQLVATLGKMFPIAPGRFTFGLMAEFTWGPGRWLVLQLGLILELPLPLRLVVLGRITLTLPKPEVADGKLKEGDKPQAVQLRLDTAGILDFDRKEFSLDATFVDSKIVGMALTGDMAIRASWGATPGFALSAGGFHPRFTPPPGFPVVRRIALAIAPGPNPKLVAEAYFAVTSNSVQFGARVELFASALGFSIEGHLSLDVLITFVPFGFEIDLEAAVTLKRGDTVLFMIFLSLKVSLDTSRPAPWFARGRARFKLWFIEGSVPVETQSGTSALQGEPTAPDPAGRLLQALGTPANWSVVPPAGTPGVTLGEAKAASGEILIHPLGSVGVQQAVLPLAVTIQRVGSTPLDRPRRYVLTGVTFGSRPGAPASEPIMDWFAPGEFFDLTDDQRLSLPGFQQMEAGRRFGAGGADVPDATLTTFVELSYEPVILDAPDEPSRPAGAPETLAPALLDPLVATAPAVVAPGRDGARRFSVADRRGAVSVAEPKYAPADSRPGDGEVVLLDAFEALHGVNGHLNGRPRPVEVLR